MNIENNIDIKIQEIIISINTINDLFCLSNNKNEIVKTFENIVYNKFMN